MKYSITTIILITITALLFCNCIDNNCDNDLTTPYSEYPNFKSVVLSDTKAYSGVPIVRYSETYQYDINKRLLSQTHQQHVGDEVITTQYELSYANNKVEVSGENYLLTYHIDSDNLAVSCSYMSGLDNREYQFIYTQTQNNRWLSKVIETIDGELFSEISFTTPDHQTAVLNTKMHGTSDDCILTLVHGNELHLPNPYLLEIHPLALHKAAFYARLFGPMPCFITRQEVPILNEYTTYSYDWDSNGFPTTCFQAITSENKTFNREMKYSIEMYN